MSYKAAGVSVGPFYVETDGKSITAGVELSANVGEGIYSQAGVCKEVSFSFQDKKFEKSTDVYVEAGVSAGVREIASIYAGAGKSLQ